MTRISMAGNGCAISGLPLPTGPFPMGQSVSRISCWARFRSGFAMRWTLYETDQGLAVGFEDNGNGDNPLSKKMKDVVEQALARNGCSSWKFEEQTVGRGFAK